LEQLPDFPAIADELAFAGKLARAYDQRLTFHPSHFVKLAPEGEDLLAKSIKELEVHSRVFDLMGYPPSHENKINIHIGGTYGDKNATLKRFAANFKKLSPACQKRLTVENDDVPSAYSLSDLLPLHQMTGIPLVRLTAAITARSNGAVPRRCVEGRDFAKTLRSAAAVMQVFDFHHQKFCPGALSEKEGVLAAVKTWPPGIRPVVHWSESQEGRKPHAHSDYISVRLLAPGIQYMERSFLT
jgi:UV DNA damage endonuclease